MVDVKNSFSLGRVHVHVVEWVLIVFIRIVAAATINFSLAGVWLLIYLELTIVHRLQSWPCPHNCVRTCVWLLLEGSYYFFRRAPGAATIRGAASIQINMVPINC